MGGRKRKRRARSEPRLRERRLIQNWIAGSRSKRPYLAAPAHRSSAAFPGTSGLGGNDGLLELLHSNTIDYALANFRFALLEVLNFNTPNFNTPDEVISGRESHLKDVLLSRQFG